MEGDDNKLHKAKWNSFLKDAAFYMDLPNLQEQREMRFTLQRRYDDLFAESWNAPLQSRRDLLTWVCQKRNSYMSEKSAPEEVLEDCENYAALVRKYGPDYDALKAKLGHVRGLFD